MAKNIGVDAAVLAGLQKDMMSKLLGGNMTVEQIKWFQNQSKETREGLVQGNLVVSKRPQNKYLLRLYEDKEILVGATTGEETIADASDLFPGFLDSDFKNWETNKPSNVATEPAPATVFEMYEKSGTFRQIFGSLGNIDDLCWEQGQILNFVREHSDKLHPKNWATFLPFKVKEIEEPFVAFVIRDAGELKAVVYRFGDVYVWDAWRCRRVVVPQLES